MHLGRPAFPPWARQELEALLSLLFRKVRIGERSSPKGYDWSRVDDAFWFEMHHHPWIQNWLRQPDPPEGLPDPERHNRQWIRDLPKRWAKP